MNVQFQTLFPSQHIHKYIDYQETNIPSMYFHTHPNNQGTHILPLHTNDVGIISMRTFDEHISTSHVAFSRPMSATAAAALPRTPGLSCDSSGHSASATAPSASSTSLRGGLGAARAQQTTLREASWSFGCALWSPVCGVHRVA